MRKKQFINKICKVSAKTAYINNNSIKIKTLIANTQKWSKTKRQINKKGRVCYKGTKLYAWI